MFLVGWIPNPLDHLIINIKKIYKILNYPWPTHPSFSHPTLSLTLRAQFLSRSLPHFQPLSELSPSLSHSQPPSKLSPSLPHSQPSLFVLIVFFWFCVFAKEVVRVERWTDRGNACGEGGEDGVEVGVREASIQWVWLPDLMRTHQVRRDLVRFWPSLYHLLHNATISTNRPYLSL